MSKSDFYKDWYRYYGTEKETVRQRMRRPMEIAFLYYFRRVKETSGLLNLYYRWRFRHISQKSMIQIPHSCHIGPGFYIGHSGRIIVNPNATIGKNVNIATGVTIGQENRGQRIGSPTVGDHCWIGTNSVIVGNIKIGTDVLIAPLTYVNFDVPDHSIVIGNPGKIIPCEYATEAYIEHTV